MLTAHLPGLAICTPPRPQPQGASLVAQRVKNLPATWETWVQSLGWEDPLEERMATHSSFLAWRIPMDRGAWQAAVHGVAKSWAQLSNSKCITTGGGNFHPSMCPKWNTSKRLPWRPWKWWCLFSLHFLEISFWKYQSLEFCVTIGSTLWPWIVKR